MENGSGVVEEIRVPEVKVVVDDDEMPESKVEERAGGVVHGDKESEGDEVFEEAIESSLDERNDGADELKPNSDDVAVSATANVDSNSGFFTAKGLSSSVDEGSAFENAVEGSNDRNANEGEMAEEIEEPLVINDDEGFGESRNDNGSVTSEGVATVDKGVTDGEVGVASVGTNGVEEGEVGVISASGNGTEEGEIVEDGEVGVVSVGTNGVEEGEVAEDGEVGVVGVSTSGTEEESPAEVQEVELSTVKEIEAVEGDEDVVEKSVVVERSDNGEGEKNGEDSAGDSLAEDVKYVTTNEDVNHVNETARELGDASAGTTSLDQTGNPEELKEVLDIGLKDHGHVEAIVSESSISEQQENGVASEGVLGEDKLEVIPVHSSETEDDQMTLISKHQDGGCETEGRPSEISAVLDSGATIPETEKSAPLTSKTDNLGVDLETQTSTAAPLESSNGQAMAEGKVIEGGKSEQSQSSQASREVPTKSSQTFSSSAENSASSAAPPARPAGLGRAASLLEPAPRAAHQSRVNGQVSQAQTHVVEDTTNGEVEEGDEIREKLQMIRVKFLRLAHRLGQTPHNVVVAQVLYRLGLAEQLRARNGGRVGAFSFDRASAMAEQLEATRQEPLDFSCTIMVLGKTGVGKSATINSIFDDVKFGTDPFQMGTKKVQDVVGTVQGIKVRVIDTPGLLSSSSDQRQNEKILQSVKRFIKKSPPDIVLYLDRLDMPSRDFGDMPLLRTITEIFGPSIWFNAIVVLTHAASAPPEGPNGTATTYDMFVTQRSHAVQQAIRQAAGDMRLMNPVSLVENHSACRTNRAGQRVLPNGQVWKPHLLLLSFASKILAEANALLKLQDTPPGKPFTSRSRATTLPFLLSSLLQSRPQLKLPEEQYGDDDAIDDDLDDSSESDEESEYDELPPFRPLTKAQLAKLSKAQKKAYYDEMEYREKLLMRKQLKEERRRRRMMKKMAAAAEEMPAEYSENVEEDSGGAAPLSVPMVDVTLPASFDSDNPTHRYRSLEMHSHWLVRPVLDNHGWDHDVGYEGVNVERMFVVKDKIPLSLSGQVSKDKKDANLQMEVASSVKHGEGKATTFGFDMQNVGKDMAYTLRSETRFSNYRHNKATAGFSATVMGDSLSAGLKLEDKLIVNKQFRMVMSGGAMACRGDIAYGGSLEATLRDKDYPLGRFLTTLGLSVMDWHGELALGGNIQSQIPVGRGTNLIARANLNNRGSGQVSLRLNSSEQVQLALIGLIPLVKKLIGQYQEQHWG